MIFIRGDDVIANSLGNNNPNFNVQIISGMH
jgi:hypothetical protein